MPHVHDCQLRWADLDLLGHVNNVTYLSYLAEARHDLTRSLGLGLLSVRGHGIHYVAPLPFGVRPVSVAASVASLGSDSVVLATEVYDESSVLVRATTHLAATDAAGGRRLLTEHERAALAGLVVEQPPESPHWQASRHEERGHWAVAVRQRDLATSGHVSDVAVFEYFQEARIRLMGNLARAVPREERAGRSVVVRADVELLRPMPWRPEGYDAWTWLVGLGRSSVTMQSDLTDGLGVVARARVVLVAWDPESGRSRELPPSHRAVLEDALR